MQAKHMLVICGGAAQDGKNRPPHIHDFLLALWVECIGLGALRKQVLETRKYLCS